MIEQTINDAATMQDGGAMLAGRYRVIRQLGQGGMGSVWLAEDMQLDNKPFAIKMLPSILVSNKRAYRQLKDEALVAMKLTHPNIVTLRAFEENNGNPFLVMDYIDGQTLDDYLADYDSRVERAEGEGFSRVADHVERDSGRDARPARLFSGLPEEEVIRILRPIAAALDYAHGEGVVHRDVKPANVMIRKDGHPFILDFGIAREIQETMTRVTGKPSSGTLLYMSPEQLHGADPEKEQDVYSFAAMVYECLSGNPPFSKGQIEYQIDNDKPRCLPEKVTISVSVMAGLAKRPEDRPVSCAAVMRVEGYYGTAREKIQPNVLHRSEPSNTESLVDIDSLFPDDDSHRISGVEKTIALPGGIPLEMIYCAPGEFIMGSPEDEEDREDDEVQHRVRITHGFWMSKYPITNGQWASVMGKDRHYTRAQESLYPIHGLRWDECIDFVHRLGRRVRLPTEAEWEYACRAGQTGCDAAGNGSMDIFRAELAYELNVGSGKANSWGFYDMFYSVHQWCSDVYGKYCEDDVIDPVGSDHGDEHVLRGGYEGRAAARNHAWDIHNRDNDAPGSCGHGFRICVSSLSTHFTVEDERRKDETATEETLPTSAALKIRVGGFDLPTGDFVTIGGRKWTIPIVWSRSNYPNGDLWGGESVEYMSGGRCYSGKITRFKPNWRGVRDIVVELTESAVSKQDEPDSSKPRCAKSISSFWWLPILVSTVFGGLLWATLYWAKANEGFSSAIGRWTIYSLEWLVVSFGHFGIAELCKSGSSERIACVCMGVLYAIAGIVMPICVYGATTVGLVILSVTLLIGCLVVLGMRD